MTEPRWAWLMRERTWWVRAMSSAVIISPDPDPDPDPGPGRS
ncbi:hypothetical protein [Rhodococcus rhodochrous]|nr:hypothetical protein [Rhodococcus rhodochrous]MCQ4137870.1 hypothetical protein [Rhodococcus rhodochrous]MDJ0019699.1 hypothetical protein [Rhodococcus rhodochrous]